MEEMSRRDFIQTSGAGLAMKPWLRTDQAALEQPARDGEDLCFTSATTLAATIRQKKVSPVEVINAVYGRLHKIAAEIAPQSGLGASFRPICNHKNTKRSPDCRLLSSRGVPAPSIPRKIRLKLNALTWINWRFSMFSRPRRYVRLIPPVS